MANSTARPQQRAWLLIMLCWAAFVTAASPELLGKQGELWLALVAAGISVWFIIAKGSQGLYSLATIYLLLLIPFHLGAVGPIILFNLNAEALWPGEVGGWGWLNSRHLPQALHLCAAAFAWFAFGVMGYLFVSGRRRAESAFVQSIASQRQYHSHLFWGGLALWGLGMALLLYGAQRLQVFSASYYLSWALRRVEDVRPFGLGFSIALIGMVVAATGASPRVFPYFALVAMGGLIPFMLFGYRGLIILNLVALLIIWHDKDPRQAARWSVIALVLVLVTAPIIRASRNGAKGTAGLQQASSSFTARALALPEEMGRTLQNVTRTLDALTRDERLWWGRSYFNAVMSALPNLSHRNRGTDNAHANPSRWLSEREIPVAYMLGQGVGFSGVAEPYLNFALPGVCLYFALLGYALVWVDTRRKYAPEFNAVIMCAYTAVLFTVRGDLEIVARPLAWSAAYVYGLQMGLRLLREASHGRSLRAGPGGKDPATIRSASVGTDPTRSVESG